jgi:hypothetical protein
MFDELDAMGEGLDVINEIPLKKTYVELLPEPDTPTKAA